MMVVHLQQSVVTLFTGVAADIAGGHPHNRQSSSVTGGISRQAALRAEQCDKMYRTHKLWNVETTKISNMQPFPR
jgi:hypothetical protein